MFLRGVRPLFLIKYVSRCGENQGERDFDELGFEPRPLPCARSVLTAALFAQSLNAPMVFMWCCAPQAVLKILEDDSSIDDRLMSLLVQGNFTSDDLIDLFGTELMIAG